MKAVNLFALAGALAVAACAGPEPGSPAWTAQQEQKKQEARAETVKDAVAEIPTWYGNPPDDDVAIYAPGSASSTDLQFAIDKAVIAAKRSLADRLNSRLSAKLKEYLTESGAAEDARMLTETESVTSNLVTEVNLTGYSVTERKMIASGNQYRAYVLVQYPLASANRLLVDQVQKDEQLHGKLRASGAFQELERDIEAARKAKP